MQSSGEVTASMASMGRSDLRTMVRDQHTDLAQARSASQAVADGMGTLKWTHKSPQERKI